MADFDSIRVLASSLARAERVRLARLLLNDSQKPTPNDEIGVGERGLAAWTESTRSEDWSDCYPPSLRTRKAG